MLVSSKATTQRMKIYADGSLSHKISKIFQFFKKIHLSTAKTLVRSTKLKLSPLVVY